jgi:hypothetical protein
LSGLQCPQVGRYRMGVPVRSLLVLRGGDNADADLMEDEDIVKLNPRNFHPDERYAELSNMTLEEFEDQVYGRAAVAIENLWSDEEDMMVDIEGDEGKGGDDEDGDEGYEAGVPDAVELSKMPVWMRESLEKQSVPVGPTRMTSFLEKYHEFRDGKVNTTNLQEGIDYVQSILEQDDSPVKMLLNEIRANASKMEALRSVGLSITCNAPLHVCIISKVVPLLSAWDEGVQPGDILVAINGQPIKQIVQDALKRYQQIMGTSGQAGGGGMQLSNLLDVAKRQGDSWRLSNETDPLIHETLEHLLKGREGACINVTLQRTFRHIQRTLKGGTWRHPLYDGKPVLKTVSLTCREKEELPPNWVVGFRTKPEHVRVHRRESLLAELLEAGCISQARYDHEMGRIPKRIIVESEDDAEVFTQIYPCYYNSVSGAIALKRPLQDSPAAPAAATNSRQQQSVTADFWNAACHGNLSLLAPLQARGADVNWRNPDWRLATPLHKASEHGHLAVVEALLDMGADAHKCSQLGWSALHYACFSGSNLDVVGRLVRQGLDVNSATETGYTPLHMCAFNGNHKAMELLVAAGADKAAREKFHEVNAAELVMMNAGLAFVPSGQAGVKKSEACLAALAPLPVGTRSRRQLEDEFLLI